MGPLTSHCSYPWKGPTKRVENGKPTRNCLPFFYPSPSELKLLSAGGAEFISIGWGRHTRTRGRRRGGRTRPPPRSTSLLGGSSQDSVAPVALVQSQGENAPLRCHIVAGSVDNEFIKEALFFLWYYCLSVWRALCLRIDSRKMTLDREWEGRCREPWVLSSSHGLQWSFCWRLFLSFEIGSYVLIKQIYINSVSDTM